MDRKRNGVKLNPYILVIVSFLFIILLGAFLISMPWANKYHEWIWNLNVDGHRVTFLDCFFVAVSATCVTGLQTFPTAIVDTLTFGGQFVLMLMIQIGGLGFITILTFLITLFKRKLEFRNRYFVSQMVNSTNFADVVKFVRKIIVISLSAELIGTLLCLPVFLTMYNGNINKGIWVSVFHAVSSFNNAGFDLFKNSMVGTVVGANGETINYALYVYLCAITMILIIAGGISFMVIVDIFHFKKKPSQWRVFTKIVLLTSGILLVGGTLLFALTDCFKGSNSMTFLDAIFESVTCRTAGFSTYAQQDLSSAGKVTACILMFIGGSPLSTAGGIKTTTVYMVVLAMISYFRGKKATSFKRTYSNGMIVRAMSLTFMAILIVMIGYVGLCSFGLDAAYNYDDLHLNTPATMAYGFEVFSAMGTVGLGIGIEPYLSVGSKIVLCFIMFFGRIGPITFLQVFQANMDKETHLHYQYVEEDFLIG